MRRAVGTSRRSTEACRWVAENIHCDGCRAGGRIADKECKARQCAIDRGVNSYAECEDFVCEKVGHLLASREGLLIFCRLKMAGLRLFLFTKDETFLRFF